MTISRKRTALIGFSSVVITAILIFGIAFFAGWRVSKDGFRIRVRFNFLGNLVEGAPVLVAGGLKVGFVEKIYQEELQTFLLLYLDSELEGRIPKNRDTRISIFTNNLMGQKYISLVIGEPQEGDSFLQEGDTIRGIDPPSIDQMMLSFSRFFGASDSGEVLNNILVDLKTLNNNISGIINENREDVKAIMEQSDSSFGGLRSQFNQLGSQLTKMEKSVFSEDRSANFSAIVKNMGTLTKELDRLKKILDQGQGSLMKLVQDKNLRDNTKMASAYARDFLRCINERPWVLIYRESCN